MSYKEKQDLVEQARKYAKHDEYSVTRNYINALCDEIERLRELNRNVLYRIQDNREMFEDAERYHWLKTASWDLPEEVIAPTVISCDGRGNKWEWLTGIMLDEAIDKFRKKGE
jgi:plasmid stabilization system protein ParE